MVGWKYRRFPMSFCGFSWLLLFFFSLQISDYERDLAECRLLISQHEARMKSLQESMREAENKKRTLEENIDALREECAKMKAAGNTLFVDHIFCNCLSLLISKTTE